VSTVTVDIHKCCHYGADVLEAMPMKRSPYDLVVLRERAELWRAEAAVATFEAMRAFCLTEAHRCEQRVHMSLSTPVIRERLEQSGIPPAQGRQLDLC
jgi:hypothetical protein